jgi:hypothetical protein
MLSSDNIEELVKWRMGRCYLTPVYDWRSSDVLVDSIQSLQLSKAGGIIIGPDGVKVYPVPGRPNFDAETISRVAELRNDLEPLSRNLQGSMAIFAAMEDARLFPSIVPMLIDDTRTCFQLSHNRPVDQLWRRETEMIIWPHFGRWRWFQQTEEEQTAWKDRKEAIFWRGQATGSCLELGDVSKPVLTGIRKTMPWLRYWLEQHHHGRLNEFEEMWCHYARLVAVHKFQGSKHFDFKITPMKTDELKSSHLDFLKGMLGQGVISDRIEPKKYQRTLGLNKYRLVIEGNDCPSSFRADMLSGSLLLMARPIWENELFYGIKENEHYIPIRADFSDLEEKFDWCRENDAICREVAREARAHAKRYFNKEVEVKVQMRILERLSENFSN